MIKKIALTLGSFFISQTIFAKPGLSAHPGIAVDLGVPKLINLNFHLDFLHFFSLGLNAGGLPKISLGGSSHFLSSKQSTFTMDGQTESISFHSKPESANFHYFYLESYLDYFPFITMFYFGMGVGYLHVTMNVKETTTFQTADAPNAYPASVQTFIASQGLDDNQFALSSQTKNDLDYYYWIAHVGLEHHILGPIFMGTEVGGLFIFSGEIKSNKKFGTGSEAESLMYHQAGLNDQGRKIADGLDDALRSLFVIPYWTVLRVGLDL